MTAHIAVPHQEKVWQATAGLITDNQRFLDVLKQLHARPNWDALCEAQYVFDGMVLKLRALEELVDPIETTKVVRMRSKGSAA